jgi:type II secretory pathway component GspD/PulD (secretin)
MTKQLFQFEKQLVAAIALCLGATLPLCAQFPGFGGFGQGQNQNRAANTRQYNAAGTVGSATISVDPETRQLIVIADEETSAQISQVVTNLDRPKPQVLIKVVFVEVTHADGSEIGVEGGFTRSDNGITAMARTSSVWVA